MTTSPAVTSEEPLSDEALLRALGTPTGSPDRCAVCTVIGESAWYTDVDGQVTQDTVTGKRPALARLRERLRLGENLARVWVTGCPECGTLYVAEGGHDSYLTGTESAEGWYRTTPEKILAMPELGWSRKPGALLRGYADGVFAVIGEPHKRWPIRRL